MFILDNSSVFRAQAAHFAARELGRKILVSRFAQVLRRKGFLLRTVLELFTRAPSEGLP